MRAMQWTVVAFGMVVAAGCQSLDVGNLNAPALDDLLSNPTRGKLATAATGLLIGTRAGIAAQNGYVSLLGILGRESYNFDPADPRFVTEMMVGPLDGGSPAFGGNGVTSMFRAIAWLPKLLTSGSNRAFCSSPDPLA